MFSFMAIELKLCYKLIKGGKFYPINTSWVDLGYVLY